MGGEEVLVQLVESCEEYGALTGQARHTMLDEAPVVLEYVPGGHLLQVLIEEAPVVLEYVPAGQPVQV